MIHRSSSNLKQTFKLKNKKIQKKQLSLYDKQLIDQAIN